MYRTIHYYLNTLYWFWYTGFSSELEYRLNVYVEIFAVIGNLTGSLFVLSMFYSNGSTLGGWTFNNSLIVLSIYTFLEGLTTCFLHPNLSRIVRHVQHGTLDYILLKPIQSQLWLSLRIFSPWGIPSILVGIALLIYSLSRSASLISYMSIFLGIIMLLSSIVILYSLWFILATTSIWFVKVWNATEVLRSLLVAGRYPISAYPSMLRAVFTFLLPIAFLTSVPSEVFIGQSSSFYVFLSILFGCISLLISIFFWRYALRFYTSASS